MKWLRNFMMGRYGTDQLSMGLVVVGIVLNLISMFFKAFILSMLAVLCIVIAVLRIFSRNTEKRREENYKFIIFWNKVKSFFKRLKVMIRDRKNYKMFRCPSCKNMLRVPKGKGKVYITCPKCGERFIGKT